MQSYVFKFVLVGDSRVGKSQLARRYCKGSFNDGSQSTVGMEFQTQDLEFERCNIKAQIWDTAGQERFDAMSRAYYRDSVGAMLVYDVTNLESLENLRLKWIPQLREFSCTGIRCIIVGNKADLVPAKDRANQTEAGKKLAAEEGIDYVETSALTGTNVDLAFRRLILSVANRLPDVKVHLQLNGLPEGWRDATVDDEDCTNSGSGMREYLNYWTNESSLMSSPPKDPAINFVSSITVNRRISPTSLSFRNKALSSTSLNVIAAEPTDNTIPGKQEDDEYGRVKKKRSCCTLS